MDFPNKTAGNLPVNQSHANVSSRNIDTGLITRRNVYIEAITRENVGTNRRSLTKPQVDFRQIESVSMFGAETST